MTVLATARRIPAESPLPQAARPATMRSVETLWRDEDLRGRRRWAASLGAVLGIHAAPVLIAAWWFTPVEPTPSPPPSAIMVDMAPMPVRSEAVPTENSPTENPPQENAPPQERRVDTAAAQPTTKLPPLPHVAKAAAALAIRPRSQPLHPADRAPTAETVPQPPPIAASPSSTAPGPSAAAEPSMSVPTWQGLLLGQLERFKRYPVDAQARRQQGIAYLRFTMDRNGRVLSARLEKSSGYELLDQEVLALIERAQPLPKPPPELGSDRIELVVPIAFSLHGQR